MSLTPKQARQALSALGNLQVQTAGMREIAEVDGSQPDGCLCKWESEALARLRWHLLSIVRETYPDYECFAPVEPVR
jgi:hypothetical protein